MKGLPKGLSGKNRLRLVQTRPAVKRRRRLKRVFFLSILLIAFFGIGLLLYKGLETFCTVEQIAITGAVRLSESDVIEHSGLKKGTSLLLLRRRRVEQKLAALPEIRSVTVTAELPNRILIGLQEREPAASLLHKSSFWLLDREGVVFARQGRPAENLPVVTGAAADRIAVGEPLPDRERCEALRAFLEALPENPLLEPAEINLSDPLDLVLYTVDGRKVLLGSSDKMVEKLALLWGFIPYLPDNITGSCLDLRTGDRLVVITE